MSARASHAEPHPCETAVSRTANLLREAADAAASLFSRGLASGSAGNISVRGAEGFLISRSGSSFARLAPQDFAEVSLPSHQTSGTPSKEWPLHAAIYEADPSVRAVVHTHSRYSTLFSCLRDAGQRASRLFAYTPYLRMKTGGAIGIVLYAPPGSDELFAAFSDRVEAGTLAYVLQNHGIVAAGKSVSQALALLEEFEASARLLYDIERWGANEMQRIGCADPVPDAPSKKHHE